MVEIVISPPPQQARMTPMALAPANSTLGTSVLKGSSGGQQFIVIPQSLLQQTGINNIFSGTIGNNANKKSVIKLSPKSPTMSPKITSSTPGIQIPQIGIKRPLTSSSPDLSDSNSIYDDEDSNCPVRKRANLDHLSPEEKMMRRKLKNRVAAQNARDKKRVKMDEMEDRINKLQEEKDQLEADNRRLSRLNEQLMSENNALRGSSPTRLSVDGFKDELPPSPESMPRSPLPTTFDSQSDQTIVVSRPSEPAELANALLPKGQGQDTAVDPKQTAVTTASVGQVAPIGNVDDIFVTIATADNTNQETDLAIKEEDLVGAQTKVMESCQDLDLYFERDILKEAFEGATIHTNPLDDHLLKVVTHPTDTCTDILSDKLLVQGKEHQDDQMLVPGTTWEESFEDLFPDLI
ncbi:hypothetical protein TCAL_09115 [Tigriopus californicus]|uniref:X-box-binding protein 1 n=1 Tax=Tigriopus californicus TaxID=6832 RepID=A0A553P5P1_TIGCA|nr:hypothetical protein TCAL_09115 [Tigriopus californicus]|eukprot:TCALIF_09115-PA protein Name:"Similar to Xbp1 X-box-binding protein 1 (Mus musculus)" AED:0.27 eAED:0.35 QI:0/0/0/0.5/1/1/2/0/406